MVFRRGGQREEDEVIEEDEDGLNIVSGDDEDDDADVEDLFEAGQTCDICQSEDGRVGLDPTCRGAYDGEPVLYGYNCLPEQLRSAYGRVEGVAVIVEPFGEYGAHYYYRLDEMPAYEFVREDTEAISWLLLTIGDNCARCGEQSHFAWLTRDNVDPKLPENAPLFRKLERGAELLCPACAATALASVYESLQLPMMTIELPRSAMGILMPTGD